MKYYIGDTHFGHEQIIHYDHRPFDSVDEMDEALIANWNRKVTEKDHVYIIGDFTYHSCHMPEYYLRQLRGHKHLIVGNHDKVILRDDNALAYFESVEYLGHYRDHKRETVLCHYPLMEWNGSRRDEFHRAWHIYAHIHARTGGIYDVIHERGQALNAGCMINGYEPCTLEELYVNNEKFLRKVREIQL